MFRFGTHKVVRPEAFIVILLLPNNRTCFAVIPSQQFKVKHVDYAVVVQVCRSGSRSVVTHADGQGIELIDDVIAINVTSL